MSVQMFRELYAYHRWANRRLFDHATSLGEDLASRDVGKQFSYTTVRRMFGHLYGADWIWLARWKGVATTTAPGDEFKTLASIRAPWTTSSESSGASWKVWPPPIWSGSS